MLEAAATSMALVDVSETGLTATEFSACLLEQESVATIPCSLFSKGPLSQLDHLVRVALARPQASIVEAAERMARVAREASQRGHGAQGEASPA